MRPTRHGSPTRGHIATGFGFDPGRADRRAGGADRLPAGRVGDGVVSGTGRDRGPGRRPEPCWHRHQRRWQYVRLRQPRQRQRRQQRDICWTLIRGGWGIHQRPDPGPRLGAAGRVHVDAHRRRGRWSAGSVRVVARRNGMDERTGHRYHRRRRVDARPHQPDHPPLLALPVHRLGLLLRPPRLHMGHHGRGAHRGRHAMDPRPTDHR